MPGTAEATPSVLVTDRSALGVSVSVSVAVLSAGSGSVTPAGGVTVAVLVRLPVAAGSMVPVRVMVTDWPGRQAQRRSRGPWPGRSCRRWAAPKAGPSRAAGTASVRVRLVTVLGPCVADHDGVGGGRARHGAGLAVGLGDGQVGLGVSVSVSVAVLSAGSGSVTPGGGDTCAVLVRLPVAAGSMVPVRVMLTDCPCARLRPVHRPVAGS